MTLLLHPRCCPDRRVVCSRTLSSIKITQAVQMNWTSSSMEESSFSLSYWTLWVKCISTTISLHTWKPICLVALNWNTTEEWGCDYSCHDSCSDDCSLLVQGLPIEVATQGFLSFVKTFYCEASKRLLLLKASNAAVYIIQFLPL